MYKKRIKIETDRLHSISETYYENIFQKSSNQKNTNKEDNISILLKINLINIMLTRLNNTKFHIFDSNSLFKLTISFMASISAILIRMTLASEFVNYFLAMVHLI
jgi:negative regulator of genetic competence, sporulation and motility